MSRKFKQNLINMLLVFSILAGSITISWNVLSMVDFFYLSAYSIFKIEKNAETIRLIHLDEETKSFYKLGFTEKRSLFEEVVSELDSGGDGLTRITYQAEGDNHPKTFLTRMEAGRLLAMSELIFGFKLFAYVLLVVALLLFMYLINKELALVSLGKAYIGFVLYSVSFFAYWFLHLAQTIVPFGMYWMFDMRKGLLGGVLGSEGVLWYIFAMIMVFSLIIFTAVYKALQFISKHYQPSASSKY